MITAMLSCSRRSLALCAVGLGVAGVLVGCGPQDPPESRIDPQRVTNLTAPEGFTRIVPENLDVAVQYAQQPLPPGYAIHPEECAPKPITVSKSDLSVIKVVVFKSNSTVVTTAAYDAGTGGGFEISERCTTTTITGPNGAGGFTVPVKDATVQGADAARGTHSVLQNGDGSNAFDQYVYLAKVGSRYRVQVTIAPNTEQKVLQPHVDPSIATETLQRAVTEITSD